MKALAVEQIPETGFWAGVAAAGTAAVAWALNTWRAVSKERVASAQDRAQQARAEAEQTTVELLTDQLRQAIEHARQLSDDAEKARAGRGELVEQVIALRADVSSLRTQVHQQNVLLVALVKLVTDRDALQALEPALAAVGIDINNPDGEA